MVSTIPRSYVPLMAFGSALGLGSGSDCNAYVMLEMLSLDPQDLWVKSGLEAETGGSWEAATQPVGEYQVQ